ncbi:MAG: glycosyltransferase, partial [Candidatus Hermodarchaeota archaeon]
MNYSNPQVTVLMPVYNGEKFLSEAIESILHQTFTDFEFLIINDGSTDQSVQIIEKYNDPRIRLIHNQKNLGLSSTLNRGLDLAQGQYIARMDCDDISHPERLKKQVEFMDSRPETGVCGTWIEIIGEKCGKTWKPPTNYEEIKISLLFDTALVHSSVMIRKSKFREYNLYYNPDFLIAQDFELWSRCSNYFPLANLPEVLLKYRVTSSSHFHSKKDKYPELLEEIYRDILVSLNINLKKDEYKLHRAIGTWSFLKNRDFIRKSEQWLQCLKNANSVEKQYFEPLFSEKLANRWFWICYNAGNLGFWTWKTFWRSSLSNYNAISWKSKLKFILLQIMKHKIGTTIDRFIDYYTSLELPDLNQSQWWSLERLEKFQNKRLQTIIKYAYNNIPGYRTKFEEGGITPRDIKTKADLYKLPITV